MTALKSSCFPLCSQHLTGICRYHKRSFYEFIKRSETKNDEVFKSSIYIDDKFFLLNDSLPFSAKLKSILLEWNFKTVQIDNEAEIERAASSKPVDLKSFETVSIDDVMKDAPLSDQEESKNAEIGRAHV